MGAFLTTLILAERKKAGDPEFYSKHCNRALPPLTFGDRRRAWMVFLALLISCASFYVCLFSHLDVFAENGFFAPSILMTVTVSAVVLPCHGSLRQSLAVMTPCYLLQQLVFIYVGGTALLAWMITPPQRELAAFICFINIFWGWLMDVGIGFPGLPRFLNSYSLLTIGVLKLIKEQHPYWCYGGVSATVLINLLLNYLTYRYENIVFPKEVLAPDAHYPFPFGEELHED